MSRFRCGQIWLVNFEPSFGHEYRKVRPALVIQNDAHIPKSNLLTVLPLSSRTEKATDLDVLIEKDSKNRLMTDSLIKTKQISSFDKRRFIKLIGSAEPVMMRRVEAKIEEFLF